ncbi:hypothetical protein YC2023_006270 [Brassica napus]
MYRTTNSSPPKWLVYSCIPHKGPTHIVLVEVLDMLRLFSSWITEMRESASPSLQIDLFKDLSKYLFKFCKVISVTLQRTEILWFQDVFQKTTKPYVTIYNLLICNSTMVRRSKR